MEFLEKTLVPLTDKLSCNRYLKAISEGFSILLPIIMIGAIFTLLANLQITPYQNFVTTTHLKEILSFAPTISKSFSSIVPGFMIALVFCLVRYGMSLTSYGNLNQFIYTMLQTPLTNLGASPFTFIIFILMCSLMWFFGLHGGMIVMPFLTILYQAPALENLEAYAAGSQLPNMIMKANWSVYASLGGAGGTIGLCIAMLFFTKSQRDKI